MKVQNQRVHEEYADDESFRELFAATTTTPHPTIKVGRESDLSTVTTVYQIFRFWYQNCFKTFNSLNVLPPPE